MKRPAGIHFPLFLMIDIEVEEKVPLFFFVFFRTFDSSQKTDTFQPLYIFPTFFIPTEGNLTRKISGYIHIFLFLLYRKERKNGITP